MTLTAKSLLQLSLEDLTIQLESIESTQVAEVRPALVLLWQVCADPTVQKLAEELLDGLLTIEQKEALRASFAVFTSIVELLPWAGDYQSVQQQNYDQLKEVGEEYIQLLIGSPLLINYYLDLGRKLHLLFKLSEEAKECFETVIQYDPKNAAAYYALARIAESNFQTEQALHYYKQCLTYEPNHLYGCLQMGVLYAQELGDYDGAITYYNQVIEQDPYMTEVYVRIAEAYYATKDLKRTKQFIEIALGINEYHDYALNLLGTIQWKEEDDVEAALETFQKGLDHKIHGDSGVLLSSLGALYDSHFGNHDKARVFFEKALKAKPNQPETLRKFIVLLENVYQDYGAISTAYEEFLSITQNNAAIYVEYADFLIKYMHDYDFAKVQLEHALEIDDSIQEGQKLARQIATYVTDSEEEGATDSDGDDFDDKDDFDDDDDDFVGGGAAGDN
jgi:tetratricopeptide (TPR) repeat protein